MGNQELVLIVDDEPLNLTLLEAMLRPAGYKTIKATNGQEGRQLAALHQPALILLDVMMPVEDGVTTCRILKADPRTADIPVIFVSALAGANDKVTGFSNGAVDYITKPFEMSEVLARLSLHIRMRAQYAAAVSGTNQILNKLQRAQQEMLVKPEEMPEAAFAVSYRAVHSAGGDFYDVHPMSPSGFAYFVADISGHDLDVSFNTSAIKALFHQSAGSGASPAAIMRSMNNGLLPLFRNGMHMTACLAHLNRSNLILTVVNAGHLPILRLTATGVVEYIEAEGDILGVFDELVLLPTIRNVQRGDRLFIYTDGVVELNGETLDRSDGIEKLASLCRETAALPLGEAIPAICSRLTSDKSLPADDTILLGIEV